MNIRKLNFIRRRTIIRRTAVLGKFIGVYPGLTPEIVMCRETSDTRKEYKRIAKKIIKKANTPVNSDGKSPEEITAKALTGKLQAASCCLDVATEYYDVDTFFRRLVAKHYLIKARKHLKYVDDYFNSEENEFKLPALFNEFKRTQMDLLKIEARMNPKRIMTIYKKTNEVMELAPINTLNFIAKMDLERENLGGEVEDARKHLKFLHDFGCGVTRNDIANAHLDIAEAILTLVDLGNYRLDTSRNRIEAHYILNNANNHLEYYQHYLDKGGISGDACSRYNRLNSLSIELRGHLK